MVLSDTDSLVFDDDAHSEETLDEKIIKWFHNHGIEPGDPLSILENYESEQKKSTIMSVSHRLNKINLKSVNTLKTSSILTKRCSNLEISSRTKL